ncbi:MAG: hypothetical protein M1823_001211 [Watsoniomyces obsoletus]|nr:MAG: hypothetical protein M1823_001211 [Watsoniomyces obsoletus]
MAGSKAPVTPIKGVKKATQKPQISISDVKELFDINGQAYANLRKDIALLMHENGVRTLKDAETEKWGKLLDAALELPVLVDVKTKTRKDLEAARAHLSFLVSDISKKQRESAKKGSVAVKGKKRDYDDVEDDTEDDLDELDDNEELPEKKNRPLTVTLSIRHAAFQPILVPRVMTSVTFKSLMEVAASRTPPRFFPGAIYGLQERWKAGTDVPTHKFRLLDNDDVDGWLSVTGWGGTPYFYALVELVREGEEPKLPDGEMPWTSEAEQIGRPI